MESDIAEESHTVEESHTAEESHTDEESEKTKNDKEYKTIIRGSMYPFTAIVGQEEMKRALVLNVVNPAIGGVLIQGERGTGKSTAVRALAELMGERPAKCCPCGCDPEARDSWCPECTAREVPVEDRKMKVINLPISSTLDRFVGSMDIESAILEGKKRFEPGILAAANRNILYVDEVNLLEDHIVDVLLDAAASGVNTVEREGVSYRHPSRFILVGTMNPEEGDLRPQLLDRFGLMVEVRAERDRERRVEIMRRRLAYESAPGKFLADFKKEQDALKSRMEQARSKLKEVVYSESHLVKIARFVTRMQAEGHRADLSILKTAMTNAAFEGRTRVEDEDLYYAASLAIPHRIPRDPFGEHSSDEEALRRECFIDA